MSANHKTSIQSADHQSQGGIRKGSHVARPRRAATASRPVEALEGRRLMAADGLDLSFGGGDGLTTADALVDDRGAAVAIQPDGKVVVAGSANDGAQDDVVVVRFNPDGTLDQSFGVGGRVTSNLGVVDRSGGDGNPFDLAADVAVLPDGKILVAGTGNADAFDQLEMLVTRYNADGTLDAAFGGGDGVAVAEVLNRDDRAAAMAVLPNGDILVAGVSDARDFEVVRFNPDGSLDGAFGDNGVALHRVESYGYERVTVGDIAVLPGGKILIAGASDTVNFTEQTEMTVVRLNPDGSLDESFGTGGTDGNAGRPLNGVVKVDVGAGDDAATSLALRGDGDILVAGTAQTAGPGAATDFALVRLNGDGSIDPSFGVGGAEGDGRVVTDFGFADSAHDVRVVAGDRILVAGGAEVGSSGGASDFAMARYNPDGTPDAGFGSRGRVTTDFGRGLNDAAEAVVVDAAGRYVLAGLTGGGDGDDLAVARFGDAPAVAASVSVSDAAAREGDPADAAAAAASAVFTISLDRPSDRDVVVRYDTVAGTAERGADFEEQRGGTLTIAAGETRAQITVPVIADDRPEPEETFSLRLTAAENATITDGEGRATIEDDDPEPVVPQISVGDVAVFEGATGATTVASFEVRLSAPATSDVTIGYATADGSAVAGADYVATSGTLTIPAGQSSGRIEVPVAGDGTFEGDELFALALAGPTGATLADGSAIAVIRNDDTPQLPRVSVGDVAVAEGNAGTTTVASFDVRLSAPAASDVTVRYATADGSAGADDYAGVSGTLTIRAGESSGRIDVPVAGDTAVEEDDSFVLTLADPAGAELADGSATAVISNDDAPPPGDGAAPTVRGTTVKPLIRVGKSAKFSVHFADNVAVDLGSLDSQDLVVTGPGDFSQAATFLGAKRGKPGVVTARYTVPARGGRWDATDNGAYSVRLQPDQVRDTAGSAAAGGEIAAFAVQSGKRAPSVRPPAPVPGIPNLPVRPRVPRRPIGL